MVNPVVHPNGNSYEESVAKEREPSILYYPNRALQSIIEHEQQQRNEEGTIMGSLRQLDSSIRSNLQQFLENNQSSSSRALQVFRPLPDAYYCPITQEIMIDPVIDPDGNTFEREPLLEWIRSHHTSPITRNPYGTPPPTTNGGENTADSSSPPSSALLYRNKALTELLKLELDKPEDQIHPSIRSWNSEIATSTFPPSYVETTIVIPPPAVTAISPPSTAQEQQLLEQNVGRQQADDGRVLCFLVVFMILLARYIPYQIFYLFMCSILLWVCMRACTIGRGPPHYSTS